MRSRLIDRLISPRGLSAVFQPIFALGREPFRVVAAEGLTRGPLGSNLVAPDVLFEFVRRRREEVAVDRAAVAAILTAATELPGAWKIHLNVHASSLSRDPDFARFTADTASSCGIAADRLVLEVIEHWSADIEEGRFLAGLDRVRESGIEVALDDVGAGVANLGLILLANPTLLKIDRSLVHGIASSARQSAALRSIQLLAQEIGAELVVEGLELQEDLDRLRTLGIVFAQGYLLGRPVTALELVERFSTSSAGTSTPDPAAMPSASAAA